MTNTTTTTRQQKPYDADDAITRIPRKKMNQNDTCEWFNSIASTIQDVTELESENTKLDLELKRLGSSMKLLEEIMSTIENGDDQIDSILQLECVPYLIEPESGILSVSLSHRLPSSLLLELHFPLECHSFVINNNQDEFVISNSTRVEWKRDIPLPSHIIQLTSFPMQLDVRIHLVSSLEIPVLIRQETISLDILDFITTSSNTEKPRNVSHSSSCFCIKIPKSAFQGVDMSLSMIEKRILPALLLHPDPIVHRSFFLSKQEPAQSGIVEATRASFRVFEGFTVTVSYIPVSPERLLTSHSSGSNTAPDIPTANFHLFAGYFWIETPHRGLAFLIESALLSRLVDLIEQWNETESILGIPMLKNPNENQIRETDLHRDVVNIQLFPPISSDSSSSPALSSALPSSESKSQWLRRLLEIKATCFPPASGQIIETVRKKYPSSSTDEDSLNSNPETSGHLKQVHSFIEDVVAHVSEFM